MAGPSASCPECRTPLRFRDPEAVAGGFDCPDCGAALRLLAGGELVREEEAAAIAPAPAAAVASPPRVAGEVDMSPILDAAPDATPVDSFDTLDATPRDPGSEPPPLANRRSAWIGRWRSPAGIAWTAAAVLGAAFCVALVTSGPSRTNPPTVAEGTTGRPAVPAGESEADIETVDERRERLLHLAQRLESFRTRHGRLPIEASAPALPVEERLSWIARLEAAGNLGGIESPDWDRSFRDPANAEFVQRARPAYLNPAIDTRRSPDGYAATHFVGVGGVGADAPDLPADHPRAGMFGTSQAAAPEEVGDGLANTMMIAGVRDELGSWAAAGRGTVRPFVHEPYVGGPDGFGTGHADAMLVLMGDGRIVEIAASTDPRVVRRMAAMNDGLDLELREPGEPGDRPTIEPEPPAVAVAEPPVPAADVAAGDPPGDGVAMPPTVPEGDAAAAEPPPEIALPELPKWTAELVAAKLAQPIDGLRTTRPVDAGILLEEVAEMTGVPIHLKVEDGIDQSFLGEPISLEVEKGTVGSVLDALLAKLDLRYVVEEDGIRLKPASEGR